MNVVKMKVAEKVIGGWDPFGQAIAGAQKAYETGNKLLGPLGGTIGGIFGLVGGFINGFLSA
ncbi:hypothetical protein [Pantoea sp. 1.19]|uniref:hypothetical protein n=1 Tax=Pantoea sp. 1.19 TaxID=1925589 RepID=UPI0009489421|nr:hypothetical protein [Pantoea sp. 1.19]